MARTENPRGEGYFNSERHSLLYGKQVLRQIDIAEDIDPLAFLSLPYADLREWIPEESIYTETVNAFNSTRLAQIKSLSFLTYRYGYTTENKDLDTVLEFEHNRYAHSLVVALVTEKVLKRNHASLHLTNTGIVTALLHDMATPALGDAVKFMDPENLHEETHWQEMVTPKGEALFKRYGIDPAVVDATIKNQGTLGKILDYTDRITYTMQDLREIQKNYRILPDKSYEDVNRLHKEGTEHLGDIYRDIQIDPQSREPFFSDPGRLSRFLHLRAILYFDFYRSPLTAGRDWMVTKFIKPFYTADPTDTSKPLTPQRLRQMTDDGLMRFLTTQYVGSEADPHYFYHEMAKWAPEFVTAKDRDDAKKIEAELAQGNKQSVFGIYESDGFNPATSYLTKDDNGNIVPLSEALPDDAERLEDIADATKGIYVFFTDTTKPTQFNQLIRKVTKAA